MYVQIHVHAYVIPSAFDFLWAIKHDVLCWLRFHKDSFTMELHYSTAFGLFQNCGRIKWWSGISTSFIYTPDTLWKKQFWQESVLKLK